MRGIPSLITDIRKNVFTGYFFPSKEEKNGIIIKIGTLNDVADKVIDLSDEYLCPGFVDIHNHGGAGYEFIDATEEAYLGALRTHLTVC